MKKVKRRRTATKRRLEVTKAEYLEAIREGVREAILANVPAASAWLGALRGMYEFMLPDKAEISAAIAEGVGHAFPAEEAVLAVIAESIGKRPDLKRRAKVKQHEENGIEPDRQTPAAVADPTQVSGDKQ